MGTVFFATIDRFLDEARPWDFNGDVGVVNGAGVGDFLWIEVGMATRLGRRGEVGLRVGEPRAKPPSARTGPILLGED